MDIQSMKVPLMASAERARTVTEVAVDHPLVQVV